MSTNKCIGIYIESKNKKELQKRADSMHLSLSKYCKLLILDHLESKNKLMLQEK